MKLRGYILFEVYMIMTVIRPTYRKKRSIPKFKLEHNYKNCATYDNNKTHKVIQTWGDSSERFHFSAMLIILMKKCTINNKLGKNHDILITQLNRHYINNHIL